MFKSKKLISILLASMLLFGCACGKRGDKDLTTTDELTSVTDSLTTEGSEAPSSTEWTTPDAEQMPQDST
ncbi:MAG: hypothetical protein GX264_09395, partial [Clostridiales bacterium]|nr:hypothetical protein [Clostridiales bacterium]